MGEAELFDVAGACRVRIRGLARGGLADLGRKLLPFQVPDEGPADIEADIGPFVPDPAGTTHVDHQYRLRDGHIGFSESLPGVDFRAEIDGLHAGTTRVRYEAKASGLAPARFLYPDLAFHEHVLQPLLEAKLGLAGRFLLHAAGVSGAAGTTLIAGRGGSFKTTYAFRLVREGMAFLGDDLVLFDRERVHPFPVHGGVFDAMVRGALACETEMRGVRKARLALALRGARRPSFRLGLPSRPARLLLLDIVAGREGPEVRPLARATALAKAWVNTRMEWHPARPAKYQVGNFLDAYHLVFPGNPLDGHWERGFACLSALLAESECHVIETGPDWNESYLQAIRRLADPRD